MASWRVTCRIHASAAMTSATTTATASEATARAAPEAGTVVTLVVMGLLTSTRMRLKSA